MILLAIVFIVSMGVIFYAFGELENRGKEHDNDTVDTTD